MDKAIFQFNADVYTRNDIESLTRDMCERLTNIDELNVIKFNIIDGSDIERQLNQSMYNIDCSYYRVFID